MFSLKKQEEQVAMFTGFIEAMRDTQVKIAKITLLNMVLNLVAIGGVILLFRKATRE